MATGSGSIDIGDGSSVRVGIMRLVSNIGSDASPRPRHTCHPQAKQKPRPRGRGPPTEKAKAKAPANVGPGALAIPDDSAINVVVLQSALDAKVVILGHPVFDGIQEAEPLSINPGDELLSGQIAPFSAAQFSDATKTVNIYTAGFNFVAFEPISTATAGIPIRANAIESLTLH